jgi:hypothetical protein
MEAVRGLRLPSCYVEVSDNEMEYLDGKAWYHWVIAGAVGAVVAVGIAALTGGVGSTAGVSAGIVTAKWVGVALLGAAGGVGGYGISLIP